jgi:toxin ParE1/3/4
VTYRLSQAADDDVRHIYIEGATRFGRAQADTYHERLSRTLDLIGANPRIGRERVQIVPPVRIHPYGAHIVVYEIADDGAVLISVPGSKPTMTSTPPFST